MTEWAARTHARRAGVTVPVHRGAGFPEDRARPARAYHLLHADEMTVDDMVQFSSESALLEMFSSSANADSKFGEKVGAAANPNQ
jgi:hypothetical protein